MNEEFKSEVKSRTKSLNLRSCGPYMGIKSHAPKGIAANVLTFKCPKYYRSCLFSFMS